MKYFTYFVVLFAISFMTIQVKAAVYSRDVVYIVNKNVQETRSLMWIASSKRYGEECSNSICNIGQQFYPVTIFVSKNSLPIVDWGKFSTRHPYVGENRDASAKEQWVKQVDTEYEKYLVENAIQVGSFNPGPSKKSKISDSDCSGFDCPPGGVIGTDRKYQFDISNGTYINLTEKEDKGSFTSESPSKFSGILRGVIGIFQKIVRFF